MISLLSFAQADTWTRKQSIPGGNPTPRVIPFTFSIGDKGYIGGGFGYGETDYGGALSDFWEYDPAGYWIQKASFAARVAATAFSIGGKGYVGLGTNWWFGHDEFYDFPKSDFWEYDPASNEWIQKADFGGGERRDAVGFSIGGKGYVGCGESSADGDGNKRKNDFWEYNPENDTWTQKKDFGGVPRSWASGFSIGDKGYIGLGSAGEGDNKKDFWEYDPASDDWLQKADFGGVGRRDAAAFTIRSRGYFGAGMTDSVGKPWEGLIAVYKKDFWEYNPATDTWARKADLAGAARAGAMVFSIGGKGYVGTGENTRRLQGGLPWGGYSINDFWEFDPAINSWTDKTHSEGGARTAATAFSIGGKGYIGTGRAESGYKRDFWEFDPITNSWSQKANFGGTARWGATGFSIGNKGYLGVGTDSVGEREDFWEYDPAKNDWTRKANFGGGTASFTKALSIGNKGYLSKWDGVWEYDPAIDSWMKIASSGSSSSAVFSLGNKGYFDGTETRYENGWVSTLWEFDPQARIWTQKADFEEYPDPDEYTTGVAGFSLGNKGYMMVARAKIEPRYYIFSTGFKEYDPQTNTWLPKPSLEGLQNPTSFSIGDKGYLAFGQGNEFELRNDLWEYTPGISNTIKTEALDPDHICSLTPVEVRLYYHTTGDFAADNVFTPQLSDANGSFDNAVNIGPIRRDAQSGNIYVTIPKGMPSGTGYRIRVVSTHPAVIGSANDISFSINPPPSVKTKNITVSLDSSGTVSIKPRQVNNGSVGYCGALSYELDKTTFNCSNLGTNIVTLTVKDCKGNTATDTAIVTVRDCTPPVIDAACASPGVLLPLDHSMRDISLNYTSRDNCNIAGTILSVTSNVPPQAGTPDWMIIDNHHLMLRAAGSSTKERTYFIKITATDGSGNKARKTVKVIVPQKQYPGAQHRDGDVIAVDKNGAINLTDNPTEGLSVQANPNPSQNYFTIIAKSNSDAPITISITDLAGRIMEKRSNITPNSKLRFGDKYSRGVYFVQVIQGNERVTLRLIKN